MTATALDLAIDALVTMFTTAVPSTTIVDGPPLSWETMQVPGSAQTERSYLCVATSLSGEGASATRDFSGSGAVSRREIGQIASVVYVNNGDADISARRSEAFAVVRACADALRADQTIGGTVLYSRLSSVDGYTPRQTDFGSDATVEFTVEYRAYIT